MQPLGRGHRTHDISVAICSSQENKIDAVYSPVSPELVAPQGESRDDSPVPGEYVTSLCEHSNAEDYEFDESQDFDNSTDGMGFLTVDPHKAGYTGPQSGIAALKFLQYIPSYIPLRGQSPSSSLDEAEALYPSTAPATTINTYIDNYFSMYHTVCSVT
jgi:transcriptional regulatory protein GAL4